MYTQRILLCHYVVGFQVLFSHNMFWEAYQPIMVSIYFEMGGSSTI